MLETPNRKELAEFFKLALRVGILDSSAAIQWADSVILADTTPDLQMIEVSLSGAGGLDKTITCLGEIRETSRQDLPASLLLAYCWKKVRTGEWTGEHFTCLLLRITKSGELSDDLYSTLITLDETLSLAEDGVYGTIEAAMKEITEFLKSFQQYEPWLPSQV